MVGLQVDSVERVIRTQATPVENPYGTVADRDRLWPAPDPNPGTNGSAHGIDAKNDPGAVRNEHAALPRVPRADARQPDRAASDGHGLWGVRRAQPGAEAHATRRDACRDEAVRLEPPEGPTVDGESRPVTAGVDRRHFYASGRRIDGDDAIVERGPDPSGPNSDVFGPTAPVCAGCRRKEDDEQGCCRDNNGSHS